MLYWRSTISIKYFMRSESGATAVEYTLIASLIAMGILGSVNMLGDSITAHFQYVADSFPDRAEPASLAE